MCAQNQTVVHNPPWHEDGSYIYNWDTGEHTNMLLQDGVYVLDTLVAPASMQPRSGFARRG